MTSLRFHIEFRSDAFPARPGEEQQINPGRWGAALVEYLKPELASRGFIPTATYTEDWGYVIELENPGFRLWIGCGNYEEFPDGFLCFVEPFKPFVRKWFRKINSTTRAKEQTPEQVARRKSGFEAYRQRQQRLLEYLSTQKNSAMMEFLRYRQRAKSMPPFDWPAAKQILCELAERQE